MYDKFKTWLMVNHNYTERSLNDIVSRLRRSRKFNQKIGECTLNEALVSLTKNEDYKKLNISVKSQLKKSIILFYEYKDSRP